MNYEKSLERFEKALSATFKTKKRTASFMFLAIVSYIFLVLGSFPQYSIQMSAAGLNYLFIAVIELTLNTYNSSGALGLSLTLVYALFTGIALVNMSLNLKVNSLEVKNIGAVAPGFIASGCASCGVGLLGFLGFTGALSIMPFQGNLVRLGGICLIIYFLIKSGDPDICEI